MWCTLMLAPFETQTEPKRHISWTRRSFFYPQLNANLQAFLIHVNIILLLTLQFVRKQNKEANKWWYGAIWSWTMFAEYCRGILKHAESEQSSPLSSHVVKYPLLITTGCQCNIVFIIALIQKFYHVCFHHWRSLRFSSKFYPLHFAAHFYLCTRTE